MVLAGAGPRVRLTGTGALWENAVWAGRNARWAASPCFRWPPLRLARLRFERGSVCVVCPLVLRFIVRRGEAVMSSVGRAIGLDVHLGFCEVAACADGQVG